MPLFIFIYMLFVLTAAGAGQMRGHFWEGLWFGVLLGPLGIFAALLVPDDRGRL